ncbi:enoyl-CoA hydratase/isomerase family protein [Flammeovirga yaeyamensis]|uniref:Enoyl-CoA hydratase/isomerase family protein n=1 Tax=Flammeovirga yaeyamensis TaxID=367791 RepID=A0AAX1N570_9BACT|nr:enoyl-CoA hydratase-related protein [Flammeovirga yaeyamensis]MBB3698319.1 methylglutaconyl-CoA hydratase [Flammeovirga yaeyamensis]NMF34328.1 enoyl-CoA hydratase/isomerase family protein [Flammeovirga yaeyamensis]QWG01310.1 enoyl-CoA hydratase/isomerase family protein [Flammeovirga yaeyamensis]
MNEYQTIIYNKIEQLGIIQLNRPDKRNALNDHMVKELTQLLLQIKEDAEVKAIILKGNGKVFCAGADLQYIQQLQKNTYEENLADSNQLKELFYLIYTFPKIIISQIHGAAIAGGCGLATLCDFAFASDSTKFSYSEVKIGFIPAIVSIFLTRKIGEGKALQLLLSGQIIKAKQALDYGLINGITEEELLEEEVLSFAKKLIKETSVEAKANTKNLVHSTWHLPIDEALDKAVEANAKARSSEDCKKGIASFLNKEKIEW